MLMMQKELWKNAVSYTHLDVYKRQTYVVAVAVTDKVELFEKISTDYGTSLTYEQQSNAVNVWYLAKYNTTCLLYTSLIHGAGADCKGNEKTGWKEDEKP